MKFGRDLEISDDNYVEEKTETLVIAPSEEIVPVIEENNRTVTATCLVNVRKEASLSAEVVEVLEKGTRKEVKGEYNGWYKFDNGYSMMEYYE